MGKKKRGNKKKSAGGRGGRGKPSAGSTDGSPPRKDGAAFRSVDDDAAPTDESHSSPPQGRATEHDSLTVDLEPAPAKQADAVESAPPVSNESEVGVLLRDVNHNIFCASSDGAAIVVDSDNAVTGVVPPPNNSKGAGRSVAVELGHAGDLVTEPAVSMDGSSNDCGTARETEEVTPYLCQVELEDVDLDVSDKHVLPPPLAGEFNGIKNATTPPTNHPMAFSHDHDANEIAFAFLTASLREALGEVANGVSDDTLRRYLRWKPDVQRAATRFRAYRNFRKDHHVFDGKPLLLSQDPKLTFLIQNGMVIAPEELVAKDGSRVVVVRAAHLDISSPRGCSEEDASRAIFYILQHVVERATLDLFKGITIVLDLGGATRRNVPRRLANILSDASGCFPLRVRAICVVTIPWWFPSSHKMLFSSKMRARIHILKDKKALSEFIETDRLLETDGGIYNFDLQSWVTSSMLEEINS